jgi:hypothetical protein
MQKTYVMTVAGGLTLMLLATSCASKSNTRTTANQPRDRAVASESRDRIQASRDVAPSTPNATEMPITERPVPLDRRGSSDSLTPAGDRVVHCADAKGDITGSMDCRPGHQRTNERAERNGTAHDPRPEVLATCAHQRDDQGRIVYDDPKCPTQYTPETLVACSHRTDAQGRIVYDDPKCPTRYRPQMGSSFQNVDVTRESAFFDRHMNNAVKHAREAEIAGTQGFTTEMLRHVELSLDDAKEAQRAGNVPGLNEGIMALRETLRQGHDIEGTEQVREARIQLSQAAGMKSKDTRPIRRATQTSSSAVRSPRTVRGELIGDEATPRADGNRQYVLRDPAGTDTRILLPSELNQNVQPGDMVEAQLDPDGRVVGINKQ